MCYLIWLFFKDEWQFDRNNGKKDILGFGTVQKGQGVKGLCGEVDGGVIWYDEGWYFVYKLVGSQCVCF